MVSTNFVNGVTLTDAGYFNDVNDLAYEGTFPSGPSALVVTGATTLAVFNTVATTVNAFGAASVALNIGHASAAAAFPGGVSIPTGKTLDFVGTGGINGTATNDNAATGTVGEYVSSEVLVGSAVSLTTGTAANVTSISLGAGDWDVQGNAFTNPAGGAVTSYIETAISTTTATLPTRPGKGSGSLWQGSETGLSMGFANGPMRLSLASTTIVYLVVASGFTSTCGAYGFIGARRVR